jgi:hypothetical protein
MSVRGSRNKEDKTMTGWSDGRAERLADLVSQFKETMNRNEVGLTFLAEVISDNHERVRMGHENIIVLGELGSYAIPVRDLLDTMTNPFNNHRCPGMPTIEVHPKGKWVRNNSTACVQSQVEVDSGIPATDVIASIILGLLSDRLLFIDPSQESFRNALRITYGLSESPITEGLITYFEAFGATLDTEAGEIRVKGTHGFTWHLGFDDPEVRSFSVSSSIRGGLPRLHMDDTYDWMADCRGVRRLAIQLATFPRGLMMEHADEVEQQFELDYPEISIYNEFSALPGFVTSVSEHFAPLLATADAMKSASLVLDASNEAFPLLDPSDLALPTEGDE